MQDVRAQTIDRKLSRASLLEVRSDERALDRWTRQRRSHALAGLQTLGEGGSEMTDEEIGKLIDALPDPIEFVTPYFAFAREIERRTLERAAQECEKEADDSKRHRLHDFAAGANICASNIRDLMEKK
jgi:hypothetical protein